MNQPGGLFFFTLQRFKLPHIYIQVTSLHRGDGVESISNFLIGNPFYVIPRIVNLAFSSILFDITNITNLAFYFNTKKFADRFSSLPLRRLVA